MGLFFHRIQIPVNHASLDVKPLLFSGLGNKRFLLIVLGDLFYPYCVNLEGVNRRNDSFEYKYDLVTIFGNC